MSKIVINPLSRIEGDGKVSVFLDENGEFEKARFQILEFRGFEEFVKNRLLWEMPLITSKICGICPIPHHLAALKAAEQALGITALPPTAIKLRKMLLDAGSIQDHTLHFLYLAFPDFVYNAATPPEKRGITGLLEDKPELVKKAIFLRKCGVKLAETIGGHSIYPITPIPGGMSRAFPADAIGEMKAMMRQALVYAQELVKQAWQVSSKLPERMPTTLATKFMCITAPDGTATHYDGLVKVMDHDRRPVCDFRAADYEEFIEEEVERHSWSKFPFLKKLGPVEGTYRVGPLARCNITPGLHTPIADKWLQQLKKSASGQPLQSMFYYHVCRCIELIHHIESVLETLDDPEIVGRDVRVKVTRQAGEGVGIVEAPRGTLIHHYNCRDNGEVQYANMIVPTTHNNRALNQTVGEVARACVKGGTINESGKQRIEMAVRSYDPCLSCATHSWDRPTGLHLEILQRQGTEWIKRK
jgi:NAD-reducing hydrogenase large subunit